MIMDMTTASAVGRVAIPVLAGLACPSSWSIGASPAARLHSGKCFGQKDYRGVRDVFHGSGGLEVGSLGGEEQPVRGVTPGARRLGAEQHGSAAVGVAAERGRHTVE